MTANDTSFFGKPNLDEKTDSLEFSIRSADDRLWLSVHILNVRNTRPYVLDSETEGRITVLMGDSCDGAMGDLLGQGCRWYSSDFFAADCWAALRTIENGKIDGDITCSRLGANCPSGTGIRTAAGACADGERVEPISLTATFQLREPRTLLTMT